MNLIWLVLAGIVSGIVGGMGMGGGTLLIPILTIFLSFPQKNAQAFHHGEQVKKYQAIADSLRDKVLTIGLKFGANGKAFGSITKQEVFNKLTELNIPADKKMIVDFEPIKNEGEYAIAVQFMKEVKCEVKVKVIAIK